MKKLLLVLAVGAFVACNNGGSESTTDTLNTTTTHDTTVVTPDTSMHAVDTTAHAVDTMKK